MLVLVVYHVVILILFYALNVAMVTIWLMDFVFGQLHKIQHKIKIHEILIIIIIIIQILIIRINKFKKTKTWNNKDYLISIYLQ